MTRAGLIVLGVAGMAYAVVGALADPDLQPLGVLVFLVASVAGHDLVWMPFVLLAGAVLGRSGTPARAALIVAGTLGIVAVPLVAEQPARYGPRLLVLLAAVAAVAWAARRIRRKRSESSSRPGER